VELLDFLVERRTRRTIATASETTNLEFYLEHLSLERWFARELIVYDDGSRPGKPAPDIYCQAARNLGLAPAQCVVVEDAVSGIEAARAAGIGHVVVLGPIRHHRELAQLPGVDRVIENLGELPRDQLFQ
jgi:beta-phosphoglucomutase-like phosphatase (HAD superfamily)